MRIHDRLLVLLITFFSMIGWSPCLVMACRRRTECQVEEQYGSRDTSPKDQPSSPQNPTRQDLIVERLRRGTRSLEMSEALNDLFVKWNDNGTLADECERKYFNVTLRNQVRDNRRKILRQMKSDIDLDLDNIKTVETESRLDAIYELNFISKKLAQNEKTILEMKLNGYQYQEIGHALGISPEFARQLFSRNICSKAKRLKKFFE